MLDLLQDIVQAPVSQDGSLVRPLPTGATGSSVAETVPYLWYISLVFS